MIPKIIHYAGLAVGSYRSWPQKCIDSWHEYHEAAKQELAKVDWKGQPEKVRKPYEKPLALLRIEERIKHCGVGIKQKMLTLMKNCFFSV